jgi:hypothetical protein
MLASAISVARGIRSGRNGNHQGSLGRVCFLLAIASSPTFNCLELPRVGIGGARLPRRMDR